MYASSDAGRRGVRVRASPASRGARPPSRAPRRAAPRLRRPRARRRTAFGLRLSRSAATRALGDGEHLEQTNAHVLVDELPLARELERVALARARGASRASAAVRRADAIQIVERRPRGLRGAARREDDAARRQWRSKPSLARASLWANASAPRRSASMDGVGAGAALRGAVEPRPRLQLIPRQVTHEDVRGDLHLDVEGVRRAAARRAAAARRSTRAARHHGRRGGRRRRRLRLRRAPACWIRLGEPRRRPIPSN